LHPLGWTCHAHSYTKMHLWCSKRINPCIRHWMGFLVFDGVTWLLCFNL
jgi:hypothetical protein